jgi:hypothetical protein
MEFQVVDEPREENTPTGGGKAAATIVAFALAAGAGLALLLVVIGTLIADHVAGPADVRRLAPARLFASVPRIPVQHGKGDLRNALAAAAFHDPSADVG